MQNQAFVGGMGRDCHQDHQGWDSHLSIEAWSAVPFLQLELRSKLVRSGRHTSRCLAQLAMGQLLRVKEQQIRVVEVSSHPGLGVHTHT